MPTRDEPRVTIRLGGEFDARLEGAASGLGVAKGALARRAMELGFEAALEEGRRDGGLRRAAGSGRGRVVDREEDVVVGVRPGGRLDGLVAVRTGGMLEARRAINAGLVRVDGRVVRDPMTLVPAGARVVVES